MVICKVPLAGVYSEALSAWQAGENKSNTTIDLLFELLIDLLIDWLIDWLTDLSV